MSEWIETFEHPAVTPEVKESFTKAMGKYQTPEDAIVGGFNAQKDLGKPFKLPESLDKLPDDNTRTEFMQKADSLLGRKYAQSVDDLADFDIKAGLGEDGQVNETLANNFKKFIVDEKVDLGTSQKMTSFFNTQMTELSKQYAEQQQQQAITQAEQVNKELIQKLGSEDELNKQTELFKRAIISKVGKENGEEIADAMVKGGLTQNAKLASLMLEVFAPLAEEGSTDSGSGQGGQTQEQGMKNLAPKTAQALGWG